MRLLLVEDDQALIQRLQSALSQAGFAVDVADDGVTAESLGNTEPYDVVVLDLGLPARSGLEVLTHWRAAGNAVPVLVLTARDAWHERVDGFQAGADDYLGKPFYVEELVARLNALIRRSHSTRNDDGIYALIAICTHLGCTPIWHPAEHRIKCPCHGSNFLIDGQNVAGPAPVPLYRAAIDLDLAGTIVVDKSQQANQPGERDQLPFFLPLPKA